MKKVKLFDENHELDLEDEVNAFLKDCTGTIYSLQYQVAIAKNEDEMEFCYSALIFYEDSE